MADIETAGPRKQCSKAKREERKKTTTIVQRQCMVFSYRSRTRHEIRIGAVKIEQVQRFKFLANVLTEDRSALE